MNDIVNNTTDTPDSFPDSFKYYKRKCPAPDFSEVLDFHSEPLPSGVGRIELTEAGLPQLRCLSPLETWKAYTLCDHPGFIFIVNPFVSGYERYWMKRCLEDYTQPPNHSNLDAVIGSSSWQNVWTSSLSSDTSKKTLLDRLHWVTLGIHHNWDTKEYAVHEGSEMPRDLCLLTQFIAGTVGYTHYTPEAAILNYYRVGSTLGGHTDHSELNQDAPIISVSFGCSAVFLLGGATKADRPVALFVDSGDILIMSGQSRLSYHAVPRILSAAERPRSCSHHVTSQQTPISDVTADGSSRSEDGGSRTMSPTCRDADDRLIVQTSSLNFEMDAAISSSSVDWLPIEQFLARTRINLNVRQVFHIGNRLTAD